MKTNASSPKGAQAKAVVLAGNGVSNKQEESAVSLLLLPMATADKEEEQPDVKSTAKSVAVEKLPSNDGVKPEEVSNVIKRLSIDELTDKADRVYLLKEKYKEIRAKRKQLEGFTISHDNSNAQLTLVDANGLSISTSNPVAIGKLLSDWAVDLNCHLEKTEGEIRSELEKLN